MNIYYLPGDGVNPDHVYGNRPVSGVPMSEVKRLSAEWGIDLTEQMRPVHAAEMDDEVLAATINSLDEWDGDLMRELFSRAGLEMPEGPDDALIAAAGDAIGVKIFI